MVQNTYKREALTHGKMPKVRRNTGGKIQDAIDRNLFGRATIFFSFAKPESGQCQIFIAQMLAGKCFESDLIYAECVCQSLFPIPPFQPGLFWPFCALGHLRGGFVSHEMNIKVWELVNERGLDGEHAFEFRTAFTFPKSERN